MANYSLATDYHWTGLANDGLWTSAGNWDNGLPIASDTNGVFLDAANGWSVITIPSGPAVAGPNMIFGPEWGATLNIRGAFNYIWYLAPVQWDAAHPSVINMYDGSSISGEGIALGDTWWWSGGPYVVLNMYGNARAGINWMFWGGRANLYDTSALSITNGVAVQTLDAVSDATRAINLAGGTLILPVGFTATVNDWILRGILLANGQTNSPDSILIEESNTNYPGRTVVSLRSRLVTFQVDVTSLVLAKAFLPGVDTVDVRGSFNGWNQGVNICTNDPSSVSSNIYRTTFLIFDYIGSTQQFKFTYYGTNTSGTIWEDPEMGQTLGDFRNRYFLLPTASTTVLPVVYFSDNRETNFFVAHYFPSSTNGSFTYPVRLTEAGDKLYGTTLSVSNDSTIIGGSVFMVNLDGTGFTNLHVFSALAQLVNSDGADPRGLLVARDGTLYGTTTQGGEHGGGTVFRISTNGTFSTLYAFGQTIVTTTNGNMFPLDGSRPKGNLVEGQDGSIYGTTGVGGLYGGEVADILTVNPNAARFINWGSYGAGGTAFRVTPGGQFTTLHSFGRLNYVIYRFPSGVEINGWVAVDGNDPTVFTLDRDAAIYGTTQFGGPDFTNYGTVFKMSSSGVVDTISPNPSGGYYPEVLAQGAGGLFYAAYENAGDTPTYSMTAQGAFTLLTNANLGAVTISGFAEGCFYGANYVPDPKLFKLAPNGTVSDLLRFYNFRYPIGFQASGPITMGNDGNLYGVAYLPNANCYAVFGLRLAGSSPEIVFHPFDEEVLAGASAVLPVEAAGSAPLSYQWQRNGTNCTESGRVMGTRQAIMTIANVEPADAGDYRVVVTNSFGAVTSEVATVTVIGMQDVIPIAEYNSLVNFYNSTHGSNWLRHDRWLQAHDYPWYGVEVTDMQFDALGNFVTPGHVALLALGTNNLRGPIPGDFTILNKLEWLDLRDNHLNGNIPAGLSASGLTLQFLDLSQNEFTGSVPADLGHLPFVREFWLSDNQLTGLIPIGIGDLLGVEHLDLARNHLTGSIPATFSQLNQLGELDLSGNQLTGAIPSQLSGLLNLKVLDLSDNFLEGGIPYFASPKLEHLDLSGNTLWGPIPATGFANNLQLSWLDLSYNSITGNIPVLAALSLQHFDASHNDLEGTIRTDLPGLTQLTDLNLSFNCLTGGVPDFSGMAALYNFDIRSNALDVQVTLPSGTPDLAGLANLAAVSNMLSAGKLVSFLPQNPPAICSDPLDFTCPAGALALFAVGTCCAAPPLAYQWFVDGSPLAGQTAASLDLDTSSLGGPGDYNVKALVTNAYGYEWSLTAFLTLTPSGVAPQITTQPTNQTSLVGGSAAFNVSAVGAGPFYYQWRFGATNLSDNGRIQGSHTNALKVFNVGPGDAGFYSVLITNDFGRAVSSGVSLGVLGTSADFETGTVQMLDGQLHLFLSGLTGQGPVVISASSNLTDWVPIFTNPPGFGRIEFIDQQTSNQVVRFYRASTPAGSP